MHDRRRLLLAELMSATSTHLDRNNHFRRFENMSLRYLSRFDCDERAFASIGLRSFVCPTRSREQMSWLMVIY